MEETHVYNIFESMMWELMIETPDDPIPFLISKLNPDDKTKDGSIGLQSKVELPQQSRIFILGPPKCHSKEFTLMLSEHFKYQSVSIGDLLKKEVKKKSDIGKWIQDSMRENSYAEDQIAIDLIEKQLQ